jgi:oligopeptide transport system permease protein
MGRHLLEFSELQKKVLSRVLQTVLGLFLLWNLSFFILRVLPGSPFVEELNLNSKVEALLKENYGFGEQWSKSYWKSLKSVLRGELGVSLVFESRSVNHLIWQACKTTLPIAAFAFLFCILGSLILSCWYENSVPSNKVLLNLSSLMILSAPLLLVVPVFLWFFGFKLQWLPIAFLDHWYSYLLPIFFISLRPVSMLFRILRNEMSQTKKSYYFLNAQALGYSKRLIFFKVLLANSLGPWIQQLGHFLSQFIAGSVLIELAMGFDGLGSLFLSSLNSRDIPLLTGLIFFIGGIVMLSQLIVDLLNYFFDQRQKLL